MTPDGLPAAAIGSVFLKSSNQALCLAVLRAVFGHGAVVARPGGWLEVSGDVDLFVEPVAEPLVPELASFGIKVRETRRAAEALARVEGLVVGEVFEVAPGCGGFNRRGRGVPELFFHE